MQTYTIHKTPAVLYGKPSEKLLIYIHGKQGCKEEAEELLKFFCPIGYQVLGIDLPEHGMRKEDGSRLLPWETVPELRTVMNAVKMKWSEISLYAVSIGAYMSLCSFQNETFQHCMFVSPVVDMEALIKTMLGWAGLDLECLEREKMIYTGFGETLSWDYYCYAVGQPVERWDAPTAILYAGKDNLTSRDTITAFTEKFHCNLTVCDEGEHWFHTPEQLSFRDMWIKKLSQSMTSLGDT